MITNYFELTCKLTHDYIGSKTVCEKVKKTDDLVQFKVGGTDDSVVSVFSVVKIADTVSMVNVWSEGNDGEGGDVVGVSVDWNQFESEIKLPVDEINVSNDVIVEFNKLVGSRFEKGSGLKGSYGAESRKDIDVERVESSQERTSQELRSAAASAASASAAAARADSQPPSKIPDRPDFEDELQMRNRPEIFGIPPPPGAPSASIGDDDLYPGGVRNPMVAPGLDPLRDHSNSGMYPSRDHPLFRRMGDPSHPTGARYDDPLAGDPDMMGDGLPSFKHSSGGQGGGSFPGFGNHFGPSF